MCRFMHHTWMEWECVPYAEVPLYYHTKTPISFTVLFFPGDRWYCGPVKMCRPSSLYLPFSMLIFPLSYPQALLFHSALYLLLPFILFPLLFTAVFPAPLSVAIYSTFLVFLIWLCCSPLTLNLYPLQFSSAHFHLNVYLAFVLHCLTFFAVVSNKSPFT